VKCEQCGGGLVITESHVHGSRGERFTVRFNGCTTHRRSGAPACANEVMLRQELLAPMS